MKLVSQLALLWGALALQTCSAAMRARSIKTRLGRVVTEKRRKHKRKKFTDRFAPPNPGPKDLGSYCKLPNNIDPACTVEKEAVSLKTEIDLVYEHMRCFLNPETCNADDGGTAKKKKKDKKKKDETTPEEYQKKLQDKFGSAADGFKDADKDGDGKLSEKESMDQCKALKVLADDCKDLAPPAGASAKEYQENFGPTFEDASAAITQKFGDSDKAFEAADVDGSGDVSRGEWVSQAVEAGVSREHAKELFKEAAGSKKTITKGQYKRSIGLTPSGWAKRVVSKEGDAKGAFEAADSNKDGKVNKDEFKGQCKKLGMKMFNCMHLWKKIDADGKGEASAEEYENAIGITSETAEKRLDEKFGDSDKAFAAGDANGDGRMTKDEWAAQAKEIGIKDDSNAGDLYAEMDADKDGIVSEEEYKNAMGVTPSELKRRLLERHGDSDLGFKNADENGDGVITKREVTKHMKAVGVPKDQMRGLIDSAFKADSGGAISEDQYKNFLGFSQLEWARRVRKNIGNADQAFEAASGGKAEVDEAAFAKQCESLGIDAENAKVLFKQADADGNGSISKTEYQEALGYTLDEWKKRELLKMGNSDKAFKDADSSKDGKVSEDEFVKQLAAVNIDANNAKALYKKVDADGDGSVSETEYKNVLGFTKKEWRQRALKELGNSEQAAKALKLEPGKDISNKDFEAHCEELGIADADHLAEAIDTDGSGTISDNELKNALGVEPAFLRSQALAKRGNPDEAFTIADTDKDGVLSANEFILHCKKMGIDEENAQVLLKKMDINSDGKISATEYFNVMGVTDDELRRRTISRFRSADRSYFVANRDDEPGLSKEEFKKHCLQDLDMPEMWVDGLFEIVDDDKDDTISDEEYKNHIGVTKVEMRWRLRRVFPSEEPVEDALKAIGGAKDGRVNFESWKKLCKQLNIPPHSCNDLAAQAGFPTASASISGSAISDSASIWVEDFEDFLAVSLKGMRARVLKEYGDAHKGFAGADVDKDGLVDNHDFIALAKRLGVEPSNAEDLLEQADADQDGALSEDEFVTAFGISLREIKMRITSEYGTCVDSQSKLDQNGDGIVTEKEFMEATGKVKVPRDRAEKTFKQVDTNGDGELNKGEYNNLCLDRDEDKIGKVLKGMTKIDGTVEKMRQLKLQLGKDGELDPELQRAMDEIITKGSDMKGHAEDVQGVLSNGEDPTGGKLSKEQQEEIKKQVEDMEDDVDGIDEGMHRLNTEVHPHGHKWWRYRWEYSFVEQVALMGVVLICMVSNLAFTRAQRFALSFKPQKSVGYESAYNLYADMFNRSTWEVTVLGVNQFVIWSLTHVGFYGFIVWAALQTGFVEQMAPDPDAATDTFLLQANVTNQVDLAANDGWKVHFPANGDDLVYTMRMVNMHIFLAMIFFFIVNFHIIRATIKTIEEFMELEDAERYRLYRGGVFVNESEGSASSRQYDESKDWKPQQNITIVHSRHEYNNLRKFFITQVMHDDRITDWLKQRLEVDDEEFEQLMKKLPLYRYFALSLKCSILELIEITERVWVTIFFCFLVFACLAFFFHIAFVSLAPFFICAVIACVAGQWYAVRYLSAHDTAEGADTKVLGHSIHQRTHTEHWLGIFMQMCFFFICFSFARVLASKFLWESNLFLSLIMLCAMIVLWLLHIYYGSSIIPMFMVVMAMPPYIDPLNLANLCVVLKEWKDRQISIDRTSRSPGR